LFNACLGITAITSVGRHAQVEGQLQLPFIIIVKLHGRGVLGQPDKRCKYAEMQSENSVHQTTLVKGACHPATANASEIGQYSHALMFHPVLRISMTAGNWLRLTGLLQHYSGTI
jgi:hypothetical protein